MARGIVSVYDKTDLIPFMEAFAREGWDFFATSGTQKLYSEKTEYRIPSLADLVARETGVEETNREAVAQQVSGMMLVHKNVKLACINLRPPRLEALEETERTVVSLDVGGIAMITAAGNAGAVVVTSPNSYDQAFSELCSRYKPTQAFLLQQQVQANQHIAEHLAAANALVV